MKKKIVASDKTVRLLQRMGVKFTHFHQDFVGAFQNIQHFLAGPTLLSNNGVLFQQRIEEFFLVEASHQLVLHGFLGCVHEEEHNGLGYRITHILTYNVEIGTQKVFCDVYIVRISPCEERQRKQEHLRMISVSNCSLREEGTDALIEVGTTANFSSRPPPRGA